MFNGKKLSILGDSISTYKGISDNAFYNTSILGNPYFYHPPFPVESLYWKRLMDKFGFTLCVNNSWSGGNLSGRENPFSGVNRACQLAQGDGTKPDVIIVFMGINDLGRNVDTTIFSDDYRRTLQLIRAHYPNATVCCVNLPDRDITLKERTISFNTEIAKAVEMAGELFFIADLFSSELNNDCYYMNSLDSLHPNVNGMRMIAEVIEQALIKNYKRGIIYEKNRS